MIYKLNKRNIIIFSICLLVLVTSVIGILMIKEEKIIETSSKEINWGLSFKNENKAPIGNMTKDELKDYGAYFLGEGKNIYLTFDCGYENGYTEKILDVLKEENVKACFFVVGNYLETSSDLVKRMIEDGHTVANHSFNHKDMTKLREEELLNELNLLENKYEEVTGEEMKKIYRPPQGKFTKENLNILNKNGFKTILWSLAYEDWLNDKQPEKTYALDKLNSRIHDGCILLLHSTSKTNSEILKDLIISYREKGYDFSPIEELFN